MSRQRAICRRVRNETNQTSQMNSIMAKQLNKDEPTDKGTNLWQFIEPFALCKRLRTTVDNFKQT